MVQGKINRGRHTDHPAGHHSIRTNQCPPPPSPHFYRPHALPAAQPKHWRQLAKCDFLYNCEAVDKISSDTGRHAVLLWQVNLVTLTYLTLPYLSGEQPKQQPAQWLMTFWCWPSAYPRCNQGYFKLNEALTNCNRFDGDILHSSSSCSV